jgi:hypothetical protein
MGKLVKRNAFLAIPTSGSGLIPKYREITQRDERLLDKFTVAFNC